MPIQVTCPGCLSRFTVSDKYAGKKGPCPKCKKEIMVPDKAQEVVIHAPEVSGPKDSKGVAVLKPIKRGEFRVGWKVWAMVGLATVVTLSLAILVRWNVIPSAPWLLTLGALVLAPPIAMLGYTFLRDDELEGYSGREYLVRITICSAVFAATWLIYLGLARFFENQSLGDVSVVQMALFMLAMIAVGTVASLTSLELETGQSIMHYLAYFVVSFLLCWIMGIELAAPLARPKAKPAATQTLPIPRRSQLPVPPPKMGGQTGEAVVNPKGSSPTKPESKSAAPSIDRK
jgi:hypothetical protein